MGEIALGLWKINKASKVVGTDRFPYFSLEDKDTYKNGETKQYDEIAMTYMKKGGIPVVVFYSIYSFIYTEHKSMYSYVLNTLVGCIYTFGFINMTP